MGLVLVIGLQVAYLAIMTLSARRLAAPMTVSSNRFSGSPACGSLFQHEDTENAYSDYVIDGHDDFLTPYHTASAQTRTAVLKLEELAPHVINDPSRIALIKRDATEMIDEMKLAIAVRQEKGPEAAAAIVKGGHGKALMR